VGLNGLVKDAANLAYHGMRARHAGVDLRLDVDLDPSVGDVDVVPEDLSRVVLNLANNGMYAAILHRGGREGPSEVRVATRRLPDAKVEIRVRDNGRGIPRDVREKIFSPFFTTKPAGEGTGLGLSISHEIIVRGHGGSIEIETEEGRFTEFVVALPTS
jgi:signal transduction histidine kinase